MSELTIAVFGETTRISLELIDILLHNGYTVHTILKSPNHPAIQQARSKCPQLLHVHSGDCLKDTLITDQIIKNSDVIFICLAAHDNNPNNQVMYKATEMAVNAMKRYKKRRIIIVSSSGLGNNTATESYFYRFFLKRYIFNNTYNDLKRAEDLLLQEKEFLDYTIIQLPLLHNGPLTGDYLINLTKQYPDGCAMMSRKNSAHLVYTIIKDQQANPDSKYKNKFVSPTEVYSHGSWPIEDAWVYVKPQLPGLMFRFTLKVALLVVLPGWLVWKYGMDISREANRLISSYHLTNK